MQLYQLYADDGSPDRQNSWSISASMFLAEMQVRGVKDRRCLVQDDATFGSTIRSAFGVQADHFQLIWRTVRTSSATPTSTSSWSR